MCEQNYSDVQYYALKVLTFLTHGFGGKKSAYKVMVAQDHG